MVRKRDWTIGLLITWMLVWEIRERNPLACYHHPKEHESRNGIRGKTIKMSGNGKKKAKKVSEGTQATLRKRAAWDIRERTREHVHTRPRTVIQTHTTYLIEILCQSLANVDQKWQIERDNRYCFLLWTHAQKMLEYVTDNTWQYLKKLIELINWPNCAIVIS